MLAAFLPVALQVPIRCQRQTAPPHDHRLDRFLARLRPHREPLSLLIDGAVLALAWNVTDLFRLGFERWIWRVM